MLLNDNLTFLEWCVLDYLFALCSFQVLKLSKNEMEKVTSK